MKAAGAVNWSALWSDSHCDSYEYLQWSGVFCRWVFLFVCFKWGGKRPWGRVSEQGWRLLLLLAVIVWSGHWATSQVWNEALLEQSNSWLLSRAWHRKHVVTVMLWKTQLKKTGSGINFKHRVYVFSCYSILSPVAVNEYMYRIHRMKGTCSVDIQSVNWFVIARFSLIKRKHVFVFMCFCICTYVCIVCVCLYYLGSYFHIHNFILCMVWNFFFR